MLRLLRFAKSIWLLNDRLTEEKAQQEAEGYSISHVLEPPERYFVYKEGDRSVSIGADHSWLNDVTVYSGSFVKWSTPRGEPISGLDQMRIRRRLERYFSCWGGKVTFDETLLPTLENLKEDLIRRGIPFEEIDGVVHYGSTLEEEGTHKGESFNR